MRLATLGGVGAALPSQPTLFDHGEPAIEAAELARARRVDLDGTSWVEHLPDWVRGQDALMAELARTTSWRSERRWMYDRAVDVPRLVASLPDDGPGHPLLERIRDALSAHYATAFARVSMGLYRDGSDSVAWHGDTTARDMDQPTLVATVSLGAPRRFLLRPRGSGGRSVAFALGRGDLFVMGGLCQRAWQHAVPKTARALPRLAVMFRPIWKAD
jgi:alkylated DNA repair dioxygenase AlkB